MILKKVIVALDSSNLKSTLNTVSLLKNEVFAFKIGYEFFLNFGLDGYKKIKKICPKIFLDLKLHDIPNTVSKGIYAIDKLQPLLTTIHISGGDEMMIASKKNKGITKVLGVSVLTSLNNIQTRKYYNESNVKKLVKKFVRAAKKNKLDGVVCSPREIEIVKQEADKDFLIVTPGIRIETKKITKDDQKRTLTPEEAIKLGANLLVIGRPITNSKNPLNVIRNINRSIT